MTIVKQSKMGECGRKTQVVNVTIDGYARIGSHWLPKIVYRIPWGLIGWKPKTVKKYQEARDVLAKKHVEIK